MFWWAEWYPKREREERASTALATPAPVKVAEADYGGAIGRDVETSSDLRNMKPMKTIRKNEQE